MYCILKICDKKMMKLIRKKKVIKKLPCVLERISTAKNIKGLGGVSTAKISKAWVGPGLHFSQNCLFTFNNI